MQGDQEFNYIPIHSSLLLITSSRGVAQLVARDVWDVDAAGSNPVTPTKNPYGAQCPIGIFRLNATVKNLLNRLRFDRVCDEIALSNNRTTPQTQVLNPVTPTKSVLYAQKTSPFRKIGTDFFVYFQLLRSINSRQNNIKDN